MELTILMPCLNEAATIGICIGKAREWIRKNSVDAEILIADNGSSDGSADIAAAAGARVIHVAGKGYGAALISGILQAKGRYIIMGDSDNTYDFSSLTPFWEKLDAGYDLVVGNRFKGGIQKGAMPFLHKYVGNPVLTRIGKLFFKTPVDDFHCGLRGFRQDIVSLLNLQTLGMEFASEMIVKASLFRLKMAEVPVTLGASLKTRRPHLRTWRDGWRHLRFLLMHSPKWLFYIPGSLLFCLGLLLTLLTVFKPFEIVEGVYFDTNTLIYSGVLINTGFSCISLGMFTDTYATEEGFLPRSKTTVRFERFFTLEIGLLFGLLVFSSGIGGALYAFYLWQQTEFGNLVYKEILRIVVPSATLIFLGTQVLFSSFFLGILKIRKGK